METKRYSKDHHSQKAAKSHMDRIQRNGGKCTLIVDTNYSGTKNYRVDYYFITK